MRVGVVGLGAMGRAMAMRLLKAGHELVVYNRTRQKADVLLAQGAVFAETPAALASQVDVIFSMLLDDASTEEASFGTQGLAQTMGKEAVHVCCSTLSLDQARRLRDGHARRQQHYVSANVLGRPPAAETGTLFAMMAGDSALLDQITPLFVPLAQRVFRVGSDPVQANLVKLSLNFMIYSTIEQMAEVFALNEQLGTDPAQIFEIMTNSFYTAPVHRNYGRLMVERAYDPPGAPVTLGLKDVTMFLDAGKELGVGLPYADILRDRLSAAIAAGDGARDFVVLQEQVKARDEGKSEAPAFPSPGPLTSP